MEKFTMTKGNPTRASQCEVDIEFTAINYESPQINTIAAALLDKYKGRVMGIERAEDIIAKIRHDLHILDSGFNDSKLFADKTSQSEYLKCRTLRYHLTNLNKLNKDEKNRFIDTLIKEGGSGNEVPRLGFGISSKDKDTLVCFAWY